MRGLGLKLLATIKNREVKITRSVVSSTLFLEISLIICVTLSETFLVGYGPRIVEVSSLARTILHLECASLLWEDVRQNETENSFRRRMKVLSGNWAMVKMKVRLSQDGVTPVIDWS